MKERFFVSLIYSITVFLKTDRMVIYYYSDLLFYFYIKVQIPYGKIWI